MFQESVSICVSKWNIMKQKEDETEKTAKDFLNWQKIFCCFFAVK